MEEHEQLRGGDMDSDDPGERLIDSLFDESRPADEGAMRLVSTLGGESDRGCVLVGAAHLDELLEAMLR